MTLVGALVVAITGGIVSYQRYAKAEAAALQQKQIAAVMAKKAILPLFRETKEFKENTMVKIPFSSLPTTFTPDNITGKSSSGAYVYGGWTITKGGSTIADNYTPNGWSVGEDFSISAPTLTAGTYGTFDVDYSTDDHNDPGLLAIATASFKIVPPCPTGGVLTHTP